MSYDIQRFLKKRTVQGDMRHEIELSKIHLSSGFDNNALQESLTTYIFKSVIYDIAEAGETIEGDNINETITHIFKIHYIPEIDDLLRNSRSWKIKYDKSLFQIIVAINENIDNRFILIKTKKQYTSS